MVVWEGKYKVKSSFPKIGQNAIISGNMKRSELIFNLITIPVDALALLGAGVVSFYLRGHTLSLVRPLATHLDSGDFVILVLKIIPILLVIFGLLGLYNLRGTRRFIHEFNRIVVGVSLGLMAIFILFFFNQTIFPSRFIILAAWGFAVVFVLLGRFVLKGFQQFLFSHGYGLHRLVIINGEGMEAEIIQKILKNRSYGYEIVSELAYSQDTVSDLENLYYARQIDEIIQANPKLPDEANLRLVEFARNKGLQFSFVPNLFEVQRNAVELNNFKGVPVVSLKNTPLDGWGKVAKRLTDIIASLGCLIITLPIFIAVAVAILIDSRGKIVYSAQRGGRGKDFKFYKFRSMYSHLSVGKEYGGDEAEKVRQGLWKQSARGGEDGPLLKVKDDPRVTRVGKLIRKTKLDELPQFWNVLKGDMSMVGPRAHVLDEVDRYRNRYRRMFSIKPGIFGLSQTAQLTWPDLPFEEEIRLNIYYIENWSLWWDIKILIKTFYTLFFVKKPKEDY
jgi:exopolysaccharide biosynthesis polyprenyl glycosylphosphotransferase